MEAKFNIFEMLAEATKPVTPKSVLRHCIQKGKITNVKFEDINHKDAPDYCDAFISYADLNSEEMTDHELELLNEDSSLVHELLIEYLY